VATVTKAVLRRLVDLACSAPSVHNTQPWSWRFSDEGLRLYADPQRQLPVEDPGGRNLVISCGAVLDHFRYAARALGWDTHVDRLPDGDAGGALAEVRITRGTPSRSAADDLAVLRIRCTDRRRFTSWPVPPLLVDQLVDVARSRGARACPVQDEGVRHRLELLAHEAHAARVRDPIASLEQRQWVGRRPSGDGVPLDVLPAADAPAALPRNRFGTGLVQETRAVVESGDGVIVLGGATDDALSWLLTGEALSSLWLEATTTGLSVVPLSLPVEVDDVRQQLQGVLPDDGLYPHLLVRIGWQAIGRSELPRTPRRPLAEVLAATC
jgi:nitroreductase